MGGIDESATDRFAETTAGDRGADADRGTDRDEHREVDRLAGHRRVHALRSDHREGREPGRDDR